MTESTSQQSIAEFLALFCIGGKRAFWRVRAMEPPIVQWKGSPGAMESWFSQKNPFCRGLGTLPGEQVIPSFHLLRAGRWGKANFSLALQ